MEVGSAEVLGAFLGSGGRAEDFVRALQPFGIGPYACLASSARVGLYHLFRMSGRRVAVLPAYNCRVVVEAARLAGLETEFVDIDAATFNMQEERVADHASADSVIVATHQFGIPCDVARLVAIAKASGALLIEDCAAALGSTVDSTPVGSFGYAAVYSFEATKLLTLGRGGLITFVDARAYEGFREYIGGNVYREGSARLAVRVALDPLLTSRALFPVVRRLYTALKGFTADDGILDLSWKPRGLPEPAAWQTRLGLRLVKRLGEVIARRKELASLYLDRLRGVEGIELPAIPADRDPVLIRFPVRITCMPKTEFYRRCVARGLDLGFTFSYACDPDAERFPNSHIVATQVLCLPIYSKLRNEDAESVVRTIRAVLAGG
jgi:dTDP-4-amino-4,6-dideoxygalactose transaminase